MNKLTDMATRTPDPTVQVVANDELIAFTEKLLRGANEKWLRNYHARLMEILKQQKDMKPRPVSFWRTLLTAKVSKRIVEDRYTGITWEELGI